LYFEKFSRLKICGTLSEIKPIMTFMKQNWMIPHFINFAQKLYKKGNETEIEKKYYENGNADDLVEFRNHQEKIQDSSVYRRQEKN
jgi:hypothetical protein